jgi:amidophosphoribosyltransferase
VDTVTILEKIGHFLDEENEQLFRKFKSEGYSNREISPLIADHINITAILKEATRKFDGGYVMAGLLGHGDAFVLRDPHGIRPAFYYWDEEIIVVTSERPAIQTVLNVPLENIREIRPGSALIIRANGTFSEKQILPAGEKKSCSFERIYFSRGNDKDIYQERKNLGRNLCPAILKSVAYDLQNTVFSYIPNTAEAAFIGMMEGMHQYLNGVKKEKILELGPNPSPEQLATILLLRPRVEKIALKDVKLRTFITRDSRRNDLVAHVYDTTYGVIRKNVDTLVVLDDSIVRGTTLKQSIIRILDRLGPRKIVIVSSAPQIRYPDCYGIDMAKLGDLIAFQAAIQLLKDAFRENLMDEVYERANEEMKDQKQRVRNVVKDIYKAFSAEQISEKVAQMLRPPGMKAELQIIYQSIEGLHQSCPNHLGDWYFTGDYPTPGGNRVANKSFINYMEGKNVRAY